MSATLRPLFPIGLDLVSQPVLVIGGGAEARDKSERLLDAQALVTVVSPEADPQLRSWASAGRLTWLRRTVQPADLGGRRLVINTLADGNPAHPAVAAWARRERVLLSTYDQPDRSDLGMPAVVSRGHLRIAIATSNASPSVSGLLRRELERVIDASDLVPFIDELGELRRELRERVADGDTRRALLRQAAAGLTVAGTIRTPPRWRERLADVRRRLRMVRSDHIVAGPK
ncbi:MAG: bifunctional precorrin-2 dehydrogenase/sirohydrochlorin ferrochelatase [Spirochaetaceae bacterium]|nr:bifunctional precorrin-2 dehydrogenase/sirohydrochlorin ferrochelatase [Spirochaetaceae bacterium]